MLETLSVISICTIEEVARHNDKPFWFQLYVMRDRGFASDLVARARAAKCSALVLTLDLQLLGQRHKDIRNGLSAPPKLTIPNILNMMTKPRWCAGMLGTRNRTFGNIVGHVKGVEDMGTLAEWTHHQFDPTLDWTSVEFIRKQWHGKLILKGINDVDDALIAVQTGADAIIVSNHGGRQLDGAPATIDMLGAIVDAVGDKTEVFFDSGIRTGIDIIFEADMKWLEPNARKEMESALARFPAIDLVYAHNDPGAHGAYLAARAAGREKKMVFVGIDALPQEGQMYVKQGLLAASFEYPTGGREAIENALLILSGKPVPREVTLRSRVFTKDNLAGGGEWLSN